MFELKVNGSCSVAVARKPVAFVGWVQLPPTTLFGEKMVKIRKAVKKDFKEYLKLKEDSLREYSKIANQKIPIDIKKIKKEFNFILKSPKQSILIAEENKKMKGYLIYTLLIYSFQFSDKKGYVDDLFVDKRYRKKGLATSLINKFIKILKGKGIKKCKLGVNIKNKTALNLYKKLGFKITRYEMDKKLK